MIQKDVTSLAAFEAAGGKFEGERAKLEEACARLPFAISAEMMGILDPADPADPIARQFVPRVEELDVLQGEGPDPIGDAPHAPVKGIVRRYKDRLLLEPCLACSSYCRFCFRRETVGRGAGTLSPAELERALAYIASEPDVREVILSGGDPLTLSPRRLASIVSAVNAMPHVEVLRVHSRVPVVDPLRIDEALIHAFAGRLPVYLMLHCNHPRELTKNVCAAIGRLVSNGISVLSQSVLLHGVNDDDDTLEALMRAFLKAHVIPHYLHHPDLAEGTSHFRLPVEKGLALMQELRHRLSGLCQPHYILEIPFGAGKIPLSPPYLSQNDDGSWRLMAPDGRVYSYIG